MTDRLDKKVRVKCHEDDATGALEKLLAEAAVEKKKKILATNMMITRVGLK